MKLAIFSQGTDKSAGTKRLGVILGDMIADLSGVEGAPSSMAECCALGEGALDRLTNTGKMARNEQIG